MVLLQSTPYIILATIVYIVWLLKKPKRQISYVGRMIFLAGCVVLAGYYLLPLPLDTLAFETFMDPLLPMNEVIRINPIVTIMEKQHYLSEYFANLYPIFGGAALIGFSTDLIPNKPLAVKKHLLISFLIPFGIFVFHACFKLISGYMWKQADSGQIIWFILFYFLGYGVCCLAEKVRHGIIARNDEE